MNNIIAQNLTIENQKSFLNQNLYELYCTYHECHHTFEVVV